MRHTRCRRVARSWISGLARLRCCCLVSGFALLLATAGARGQVCPGDCNGNGVCNAGICECDAGYNGPACQYNCVSLCNNHGDCDFTGVCSCDTGYAAPNCDSCAPNYYNYPSCTFCNATSSCSGNGVCTVTGACSCDVNFTGPSCDQCIPDAYGLTCDACPGGVGNACSGNGVCDDGIAGSGVCVCDFLWTGVDCSTALTACQPGTYSATGFEPCFDCPVGKFQPDEGQTFCLNCPMGTSNPVQGAAQCAPCAAGTYASLEGLDNCLPCAPGFVQSLPGATECDACLPGTFADLEGQTSCQLCAEGTVQPLPGAVDCVECPADTYQDQTGEVDCLSCPPCTSSPTGSASCPDDECVDVDTDGFGQFGCPTCPAGTAVDCDDTDSELNPDATEICDDAVDNNCDELTDCDDPSCSLAPECGPPDIDGDGIIDSLDACNETPPGVAVDSDGRPLGDIDLDCDTDLHDFQLFATGFTGPL